MKFHRERNRLCGHIPEVESIKKESNEQNNLDEKNEQNN
jgi:hypothetical protein